MLAKLIATGLFVLIGLLSSALTNLVTPIVNFVAVRGFRAMSPLGEQNWGVIQMLAVVMLLVATVVFAIAYLFAAWLYKPSPRRSRVVGGREELPA